MGGSTLYIETVSRPQVSYKASFILSTCVQSQVKEGEGGALEVTGNLGDVMKESVKIAGTFARCFLADIDKSNDYFSSNK